MNTFLPYPSFVDSARVLDRQRLGKQRVEVLQLLRALTGETRGWATHPAARMWRGYEAELAMYGLCVCREWRRRGYKDTCLDKIEAVLGNLPNCPCPPWWGNPALHASHRAALLYKDPAWYGQFCWDEAPAVPDAKGSLPYVWPI